MKRLFKGLVALVFVALPIAVFAAGGGLLWLSRSLPASSGTMEIDELSAPVSIERDDDGVPHITGEAREDVYAALGFAHAQDRLWQMEMSRMAGAGRLSEIFGETTVGTDIWLRTVDLAGAAAASYETFPEDAKRALEAYARGVNAWMEREPDFFASRLPPEFVILGHQPEPWRPEDSVTVVKMMSIGLASNIGEEVLRLAFARQGFSPEEIADLLPLHPDVEAPPLPDLNTLLDLDPVNGEVAAERRSNIWREVAETGLTGRGASNNWVVSGERTETGSPILANDPHLGLTAPSIWYLAHLRVEPEEGEPRNMVGATLAGAPLVLLGRNDDIAWGFTNTGADVQDLFVEAVDPENPGRYRTPQGWEAFDSAQQTITVAGGENVTFTRRATRHGPVMPAAYRGLGQLLGENRVAALSWTALSGDDTTMLAGLSVWDFETVEDFQAGMVDFVTPMQSMVIADRDGNIGLIAPARVPVRGPENQVMGRAPVPGWDETYDWRGTIPYEDLPRRLNPEAGAIGTANSRIVDDAYQPLITLDWDETYRQDRVAQLVIDESDPHSMETSRDAQADVHSLAFAALIPAMLGEIEGREGIDPYVPATLAAWDFSMVRDRPEPLIAMAWLRSAERAIFADELGEGFPRWFQARAQVMENLMAGRTHRNWCDFTGSPSEESCAETLGLALADALEELERRFGEDRSAWNWGEAHAAISPHRPFGEVELLAPLFNISIESPGGPYTLNRGRTDFTNEDQPYANTHGSSFRAIYDLGDLNRSTFMIAAGQSGNVFSGHYDDLVMRWRDVDAINIPVDPAQYREAVESVWELSPR